MKNNNELLSVILPLCCDANELEKCLNKIYEIVPQHYEQFEIILVNDFSINWKSVEIKKWLEVFHGIRYIALSGEMGIETLITVGLEAAIGDYCVTLVPGADPVELIPLFVEQAKISNVIVLGERLNPNANQGVWFVIGAKIFYFILNRYFDFSIEKNTTYFIALSRSAALQINQTKDRFRFLRAIASYIGLQHVKIPYEFEKQIEAGSVYHRRFFPSLGLAIDVIVSNSTQPLRFMSILTFFSSIGIATYSIIYLILTKTYQHSITLFSLALLLGVSSIICEYIGRLFIETSKRPMFYITEDAVSRITVYNSTKLNVLGDI